MHHKWRLSLSWVDSGCKDNRFTSWQINRWAIEIRNNKQVNVIASIWLTKQRITNFVFRLVRNNFFYVSSQICICVRVALCKINCILVKPEFNFKREYEVLHGILVNSMGLNRHVRFPAQGLVVSDIIPIPMPTNILLLCSLNTIKQWLHSFVVQTFDPH